MKGLNDVMQHYTGLHERKLKLNNALDEMPALTSNERVDLVAFLLTLSDSSFVMNRSFAYPKEIISALAKE